MRNAFIFIIGLAFVSSVGHSQNLVPNPSFETGGCPDGPGEISLASSWTQPSGGTSDYFNVCAQPSPFNMGVPENLFGWQNARTGNAYAGFCAIEPPAPYPYREYIQAQLVSPMQAGMRYYVRFYVALADCVSYASDDIAVYFSSGAINVAHDSTLLFTPQISNPEGNIITDEMYWTLISGSFVASGGEQYITIGNFKDNQNTDIQFISWNNINAAYYYVDDLCVSNDSMECELTAVGDYNSAFQLSLYPNPVAVSLMVSYTLSNSEDVTLSVYSSSGQLVQTSFLGGQLLGLHSELVSVGTLPEGIYFLEISGSDFAVRRKFIVCK